MGCFDFLGALRFETAMLGRTVETLHHGFGEELKIAAF